MTILEKVIFCKEHGVSLSYLANKIEIAPPTLTRWVRGEKGITEKTLRHLEIALQQFAKEIWENVGDGNDRNL